MLVLYINSKRKVIEEESLKKQQQLTKLSRSLLLATSSIPLTNNNKDNINQISLIKATISKST